MGGSSPGRDVELRVAVSYPLLLRVLRELDPNDPRQRAIADELIDQLPQAIAARVEVVGEFDRRE